MTEFVEVIHPDIAVPAVVPAPALEHYRSLGWHTPDELEPADASPAPEEKSE